VFPIRGTGGDSEEVRTMPEGNGRGFRAGNHDQGLLVPTYLMDWVPENDLCFIIQEVVSRTHLGEIRAEYGTEGHPAYDPRMMLSVWFYGYAKGMYSSRKVAEALRTNICFIWLAGPLKPCYRTLARFRSRHSEKMKEVFAEVLRVMRDMGVAMGGLVAIDGTKMKANASLRQNRSVKELEAEARATREWIEEALRKSEEEDRREDEAYGDREGLEQVPKELQNWRKRQERIEEALKKSKQ
jgi:transposase